MILQITTFWKLMLTVVVFWLFYGFFGFEITVITLLSAILGCFWKNTDFLM